MSTRRTPSPLPADLPPEAVMAVVDSREQLPLDLSPLSTTIGTLTTGDYSAAGLEHIIAIERKSLPDLLTCIGSERERFEREIMRLVAYPTRAVIVEALWSDLERGEWRSKVTPSAAVGSVLGWIAAGIPFLFSESHEAAGRAVARMIYVTARRRWRENRLLVQNAIEIGSKGADAIRLSRSAADPVALGSFIASGAEGDQT